jgi:hypothetical protein
MFRPRTGLRAAFALVLSLLLIATQQAAFAHMIDHIGQLSGQASGRLDSCAAVQQGDDHCGKASHLSHVCATCVGIAGLTSAAPVGAPPPLSFDGSFAAPVGAPCAASVAVTTPCYFARAPPPVL